jgi:hypothetical protein
MLHLEPPRLQGKLQWLYCDFDVDPGIDFEGDPDPTFQSDTDLDPAFPN